MLRCFPLGFLAPERVIFIVVADGTCRRRTEKSLWLKINYSPAQHARTKKNKKILLHLLLRVKQKKSTAQFLSEDKPHVQSIEEEDAVAWFQPTFFGRTI